MPADTDKTTIVVVDDEEHIRELLRMGLSMRGYGVVEADDGREALRIIEDEQPALVVLDVMMPGLDGFEAARRLRRAAGQHRETPIIFLTARDETEDRIQGLRLGSDDYVTKPFSVEELVERVNAVLRRSGGGVANTSRLEFEDLTLDEETREVWRHGQPIDLTPTEYRLLHFLLANARRVLTREQILSNVWDYDFTSNASVLETYISYLRQKIDAYDPPLIQTVRGVGYSLRLPR
ncbi:MAG: response regulator transcription factor [Nitriliruptorales bacterium]|nr:response regulator transcription factor [Nitriliruptorales bacterium]